MLKTISKALERPPVYTKTKTEFWNDEYISMQMLKAHLDPEFEGATRKLSFIEQSAAWIKAAVPPADFKFLLDVGCGPGIYAERFARAGFQVTGIDFSKRSIDYAQSQTLEQGLDVTYLYQNYLTMDLHKTFDFAVMIYCDYGALSSADRQTLLAKVYQHLRPGGKFLLDVFSTAKFHAFQEKQTWETCDSGGFWRKDAYLELNGCYQYPDYVTLEQTTVVTEHDMVTYYLWNTCFTKERLAAEAELAGFKICGIYGNVAGTDYNEDSFTLAILLEK